MKNFIYKLENLCIFFIIMVCFHFIISCSGNNHKTKNESNNENLEQIAIDTPMKDSIKEFCEDGINTDFFVKEISILRELCSIYPQLFDVCSLDEMKIIATTIVCTTIAIQSDMDFWESPESRASYALINLKNDLQTQSNYWLQKHNRLVSMSSSSQNDNFGYDEISNIFSKNIEENVKKYNKDDDYLQRIKSYLIHNPDDLKLYFDNLKSKIDNNL